MNRAIFFLGPLAVGALILTSCQTAPVPQDPFSSFKRATPSKGGTRVILSDVDTPNYKKPEQADSFALIIGIEKYSNIPEALYAEHDAAAMREHLLAMGYPSRNILYVPGKKAGRASMEKYIESWLPDNVDENSRVFFYFSGHGAPGATTGLAYLVPWDGDLQFLENTGYPVKRLYKKLEELRAKEVIVAIDACFSGAGGRSVLAKGMRPLVTKVDMGLEDSKKVIVLSASAAAEITGTDDAQGHGLFTYYFLKALNERKGKATVQQVYDFLQPKVRNDARRSSREQSPQMMPANMGARADLRLDR